MGCSLEELMTICTLESIVKLYVELLAVAGELICGDEALVQRLRSWKLTSEKNPDC